MAYRQIPRGDKATRTGSRLAPKWLTMASAECSSSGYCSLGCLTVASFCPLVLYRKSAAVIPSACPGRHCTNSILYPSGSVSQDVRGPTSPAGCCSSSGCRPRCTERCDGCGQMADLDDEVTEARPDDDRPVDRSVDQFEGDELVAGELEHGQALPVTRADLPDPLVAEAGVEIEGDGQVTDPERRVKSFDCTRRRPTHRGTAQ